MQYTIRNIPKHLDAALRSVAQRQGKSLNDVTLEALSRGAGVSGLAVKQRDLKEIAGSWHADPEFDKAITDQDVIDETIWA